MYTDMNNGKTGGALLRVVCGLLCACCLGLFGCGGGSAGSSHSGGISSSADLDTTPDFALRVDPASLGTLLKGGQTVPITLDLISENGFPSPVTLSITRNTWPAAFVTPTLPSLPKGTTKVVLNVTVPAGIQTGLNWIVGNISATGGGLSRLLNSGVFTLPESVTPSGQLTFASPGLVLGAGGAVFAPSNPFETYPSDLTGQVGIVGAGLTGPVTVTLKNPNSGITATLAQSTFTPTGPSEEIQGNVTINLHIPTPLSGGTYPFTITATAPGGATSTSSVYLNLMTMTLASPPTLIVTNNGIPTSITAPLTVTGPPGVSFPLTVTSPLGSGLSLTLNPATITIPASGTITQPLTITATLIGSAALATYTVNIMGSISASYPQTVSFTLQIK